MKNIAYWQSLLAATDSNRPYEINTRDRFRLLAHARHSFQKGIVYIMNRMKKEGMDSFRDAETNYKSTIDCLEYHDYIRRFFIYWILDYTENFTFLQTAEKMLIRRLIEKAISLGLSDINLHMDSLFPEHSIKFESTAVQSEYSSKYPYEAIADLALNISRYMLMRGSNIESRAYVSFAQDMYKRALNSIPSMLSRINVEWTRFERLTDRDVLRKFPVEGEEYVAQRGFFRGMIPIKRRQGELIDALTTIFALDRDKTVIVQKKSESYLNDVVNPHEKQYSLINLHEELEWVQIMKARYLLLYNKPLIKTPGDIIIEYLG